MDFFFNFKAKIYVHLEFHLCTFLQSYQPDSYVGLLQQEAK
jgi:hypothetical protein